MTVKEQAKAKELASKRFRPCSECKGKPIIFYEPGCVYTRCAMASKSCPCMAAAPDFELDLLVSRVNSDK